MKQYHWSLESWGDAYPPENAEEIISTANDMIDAYAETHDEEEARFYSDQLFEYYCTHDTLDISASAGSSGVRDRLDYEDRLIEQRVDEG